MVLLILIIVLAAGLAVAPSIVGISVISAQNNNQYLRKRFVGVSLLLGAIAGIATIVVHRFIGNWNVFALFDAQAPVLKIFRNALIEECSKLAVLLLVVALNKKVKNVYDCIVVAASVAFGFAAWENLVYLIGSNNILLTALVRSSMATTIHASCAIWLGFFFGLAKNQIKNSNAFRVCGLASLMMLVPSLVHAIYNCLTSAGLALAAVAWSVVVAAASIWMLCRIVKSVKWNSNIQREIDCQLTIDVGNTMRLDQ